MRLLQKLGVWLLALAVATASFAQSAPTKVFSNEQLDQMLAPVALYPDSLLAQVLMASTYPVDVKAASAWSKSNKGKEGDAAVTAVQDKGWDPSVASLVAFPSLIQQMGDHPDEVQKIGDAFLAQPSDVMDSVQRLRAAAQKAGNLKTTEQQKVVVEQQKIIIEPAQPQVVYVPTYNPTVVYGPWWYPSYPPYYWPPPPGYYAGAVLATGIAWGVAIGVGNALWGGCNWGRGDIDINVNRYNNINVNNKITNVSGNRTNWQHNAENRKGAPYRDQASRDKFDNRKAGADGRQDFRGKGDARDADRARADQAMRDRGVDTGAASRDRAGDRAGDRPGDRTGDRAGDRAGDRPGDRAAGGAGDRGGASASTRDVNRGGGGAGCFDRSGPSAGNRDSAFAGAGNAAQTRQSADRGRASTGAASRPQPAARSAPAARPAGGGGAPRGGGGGGRGGRR
jgi:Protein of unknown function (DUF3300)